VPTSQPHTKAQSPGHVVGRFWQTPLPQPSVSQYSFGAQSTFPVWDVQNLAPPVPPAAEAPEPPAAPASPPL